MADKLVETFSLSKKYKDVWALNNVSISIEKGKIYGLLGPNGAGKTTLIKILTGLIRNYQGKIEVNGKEVGPEARKIISYLPDHEYIADDWTLDYTLEYYGDFFEDFDKSYAIKLLSSLDINLNRKFCELSKGMKEKVQLSLVLSRKAKIFIFDEPIAGVDPAARDVIFELIMNSKREDATIIICV